ncbi:hypothetical protein ACJMK2_005577 [Sinanodonta woodiana]|uniref:Uncharacterized protein n=1 Tax=Sinanodonta woodiana TaxID=1069815 RepID=A0ABD3VQI5_SINWO
MEHFPRLVRRKSLRSGVQKPELLSEEDETESEIQMVDSLSPITRGGGRLKNRNKKTNQQETVVDRNMKLLDGISDLDGISEVERNQIVQALLNSKKEHSFYNDQHFTEEKNKEGTSLLESDHSTDGVPTDKQLIDNSKGRCWSEDDMAVDETQAPDSVMFTEKEEQLWHKMPDKEEPMNCEEEEKEDGSNQVDSTTKLSEKSIPEVEVMDDKSTQPLESMESNEPEIENISSPSSEETRCSVRPWTLDKIESEADKVEPLHRHYRIVNGKVKKNPEFPLKTLDKLEYAKAILQMFEIYNRKLREAQTKCGNPLDWGETVKVGQHHTTTIDVKRRGQAIMTVSDSEESDDTNQKHSIMIEGMHGFRTEERKATASTRINTNKSRIPDIFEENTFDLLEDGFYNKKTVESQMLRKETEKLTDLVEQKQKHFGPDIREDDLNIVDKKSDMDLFEAQKINNKGRRRKREIGDAEDDFEPKTRVTRRQNYARPVVKENQNFEILQSEEMACKKGMSKAGFGKSKAMEAGNGLSAPYDKKDTKKCIDHENLQVESLEKNNSVQATVNKDFFEEMENLNASKVSARKGNLIPDESMNPQNKTSKFNYGNWKESGILLVEDTQDIGVSETCMDNKTLDEEGIYSTVVQDSQPQDEDEPSPILQNKTKGKHHQTVQRIKQTGAELVCKMKKFFTTVLDKEEGRQDKQEGSQSPVYKKRKLLSQNTCMFEEESVAKPGVQRLLNRPVSHESNSTDPCSQGSSTMLNPVGELYSTQISIIKEKKARNALTLNHKNVSSKSCTVFEFSDSEEEDVVKQIGHGKLPERERTQRRVSMPIKAKGKGHSQDKKSSFQGNEAEVVQEFIDYTKDGNVVKAKKTGMDRMFCFTSNPNREALKSNKKEKRAKDKSNGEQQCHINKGQLYEKKTRTNTVISEDKIEIFTDEESMDGRPDLSKTNHLPQNSWSQYSEEHSCNIKPGKAKLKLVDCSEKKVLSEGSEAVSNFKASRDQNHDAASMSGTEEKLEVDQRDKNGFERKVNIKPFGTLTSVEKVLSVESRTGQNRDLIQAGTSATGQNRDFIQAGTSATGQGRRGYINGKVGDSGRKTPNDAIEKSTEELKKQVNKECVTCPICGEDFLASQIEAHAATCMDGDQNEGQQHRHKKSEARARAHTPELENEASSLKEICYICDGRFYKGQRYQDHLDGCLEQAKRRQQEVEIKGFKTTFQSDVEKDAVTSRTTRSRARGHVGGGDKGLLGELAEAWNKHEGYNNTASGSDLMSDKDDTCSSKDESDQKDSSHLTPPDWIKDLSSSPIRTFIPISQQQEPEYFRNQFAYRLDRVEKAMKKRKRKVSRKKISRKRRRKSKSSKTPDKCT